MKNNILSDAPLYEALKSYVERDMSSFHTPGHKSDKDAFDFGLEYDLTELPETDSLFECNGAIREAEKRAEELFGTEYTAISSGGCTLAIQGMLAAFASIGDTVVFSRNIHRSAVNTAMLLGLKPYWVMHENDCGDGLTGRISPESIEKALTECPSAAAVYITSPDYYGCMSDIKGISAVCKKFNVPLLVDNAHGTHLIAFGKHPIQNGASASACSAHKTLPVLTGGAWLNCADKAAAKRIKSSMALFGSTSPNYMTMLSLDTARAWMQSEGMDEFKKLAEVVCNLKIIAEEKGFELPKGECDPVRLTLLTRAVGISGDNAAEYFRTKGVECEHSDNAAVVFILTPFNSQRDIERLENAIKEFPVDKPLTSCAGGRFERLPKAVLMPRDVLERETETADIADCVGRIAAEAACPCPPGVPVVMPGEIIDKESVKFLLNTGINKISVLK